MILWGIWIGVIVGNIIGASLLLYGVKCIIDKKNLWRAGKKPVIVV